MKFSRKTTIASFLFVASMSAATSIFGVGCSDGAPAPAADVAGTWVAADDSAPMTLRIDAEGRVFTGTMGRTKSTLPAGQAEGQPESQKNKSVSADGAEKAAEATSVPAPQPATQEVETFEFKEELVGRLERSGEGYRLVFDPGYLKGDSAETYTVKLEKDGRLSIGTVGEVHFLKRLGNQSAAEYLKHGPK